MSSFSEFLDLEAFGVDIATESNGDIAQEGRDIGTVSGVDNVVTAFVRELITPLGYLGRWVYDIDGLKTINEDYGNGVYLQLSEPLTQDWISDVISHVTSVADVQPRIYLKSVDYTLVPETNSVAFNVIFTIPQTPKTYNLILKQVNGILTASLAPVD